MADEEPVLGASGYLARAALLMLAVVCLALVLEFAVIGSVEHAIGQNARYSSFRAALAAGTAPTGQVDGRGHLLKTGTPVALLKVPSIGINEVVGEGTTSEDLIAGPGHLRSSPLPGQPGYSVILGRQAAFGGPFGDIHRLKRGATIIVTVGFGSNVEKFKVVDVRHPGSPLPPTLPSGGSRLILETGNGTPLMPNGLVYVDADLVGNSQPASTLAISSNQLANAELPGKGDSSTIWALALWIQALLLAVGAATLSWYRWGRRQTWIVFSPTLLLIGYFVADQAARQLPNVI